MGSCVRTVENIERTNQAIITTKKFISVSKTVL